MATDNTVTLIGNLTDDPELRFTPNGAAVANFRLAVTPRVRHGDTWIDGETSFFRINCWRAAGGERHREPEQGRPGRRDRPPAHAVLGDRRRREADRGRGRGRRGRSVAQVGNGQGPSVATGRVSPS